VLGHVHVGAGDEHAEIGDVAGRGPHLLAVHDPLVAVPDRLALQAGEVGAGARLAEELAPALLSRDDVADVGLLVLVGAVGGDGGCREQEAETARGAQRAELGDRGLHPHRVVTAEPSPERVGGEVRRRPAGEAEALPPLGDGEVGIPVLLEPGGQLRWPARPRAHG
jgi:hypothetical protein